MQNLQNTTSTNNNAANDVGSTDNATIAVGNNNVHVAPAAKPVAAVTPAAGTVAKRVKALIAERKQWEVNYLQRSNEVLYALLDKCYALYFDLRGSDKDSKAARAELEDLIVKTGYSFKEGTHWLAKIVKFVFEGADRRRVSAYSLVLREALAQDKKVGEIAAFIKDGKGVEEIRRSKSKTAKTAKQKAALGLEAVGNKQLAVMQSESLALLEGDLFAGDDAVAIVTKQADGSFIVREVLANKALLNAALACAYSKNKEVGLTDKRSTEAANDAVATDELLKQAAVAA